MKLAQHRMAVSVAAAALTATLYDVRTAWAEYPATAYGSTETLTTRSPNGDLIASGIFTMGIPYAASVVAATESNRPADNYLYAPVAGPWLDLANRGNCPTGSSCGNETAYRALLIADGVLQGVGALQVISGFLFPVTRSITTANAPVQLRILPQVGREGYGLTAVGTF